MKRSDNKLTPIQQLMWGCFWGAVIGGMWLIGDILRPIIYGGL